MISLFGIAGLVLVAVALSTDRRAIKVRTVVVAFSLQAVLGGMALFLPWGIEALSRAAEAANALFGYGRAGAQFVFGSLVGGDSLGFVFAFEVLPVVIFFSSFIAVLYQLGLMQWIIRVIGGGLRKLLLTSHTESMSAAANIFVSQTEAPLVVRPYVSRMTTSELFAVMVGGMASIAGSVMAGYAALGVPVEYLLAASLMAAPGGLMMAKIIVPETAEPLEITARDAPEEESYHNVIDAAAAGASKGLMVATAIGAMLIAFIGLIALVNGLLDVVGSLAGLTRLSMEGVLGYLFRPIAWLLGVAWDEAALAGSLIGQKLVMNEFVAYVAMTEVMDQFSPVSLAVVTFALCGFANLSSIAILLGGLGSIAPSRREEISRLGFRALAAASLSNLMSAALAGFFVSLSGTV